MDVGVIVAIAAVGIAALGVGITLTVLIVRGGFLLGRLVTQVEGLTADINELRTETQQNNQAMTAAINELRAEVQQSNQTLAALANHTHGTDGRTVFQVPPGPSR